MSSSILDDIKIYLPKYLSDDSLDGLFEGLKSFPNNLDSKNFYTANLNSLDNIFQGDAFEEVVFADYSNEEFRKVKGFLISNTCDISIKNRRMYTPHLTFAPIFNLEKYKKSLLAAGNTEESVNNHITTIRNQRVSTFFYLPDPFGHSEDFFVRLDYCFSIPLSDAVFDDLKNKKKFSLSNYGFYLLVMKLSIHFSRVQEKVDRDTGEIL